MPFGRPTPPPSSPPPSPGQNYPKDDLLKLGGLYPSKSGKALTGNIHINEPRRGASEPFGVILIDLIQQAMEEQRPLRFLVFESTFPDSRSPYTLNITLGNPRPPRGEEPDEDGEDPTPTTTPQRGEYFGGNEPTPPPPTRRPEAPTRSEPVPRPVRRTAPRRTG